MELHNPLIKGTFILTVTGLLTRFMGFFYRIFLSHTFGAVQVGLTSLFFPFMLLAIPQLVPEFRRFSPAVLPAVLFRQKKRSPSSFSIPDFSSRCPSPAVLQFFCKKFAPFLAGSVLGDRRCEHLLILLSYVFPFSAIHSCITGYCLGLKDTKNSFILSIIRTNCTYFQCSRYLSVFKPHRRIFRHLDCCSGVDIR